MIDAAGSVYIDGRVCALGCFGFTYSVDEGFDYHHGLGVAADASLGIYTGDPSSQPRQDFWASAKSIGGYIQRERDADGEFSPPSAGIGICVGTPVGFGVVEWFR